MHVIKGKRRVERDGQNDPLAHATGRMQAQALIDLIDETAPEDGVVDVHALETSFANGSRRIELAEPEDAVVEAVVEGASDTTRRMSAVEADALVAVEIRSESTMRMSAIQASELVALITPEDISVSVDVSDAEPVVRFSAPKLVLPIPAPIEDDEVADEYVVERAAPVVEAPVRRRGIGWMVFAFVALASASAALVLVALEKI
jgi:hypothetical protein